MELVRTVSGGERVIPPDMLLVRERANKSHARSKPGHAPAPASDSDLLLEGDALLDPITIEAPRGPSAESLELYRPLAYISIGALAWSGAVDHRQLQSALACAPARDAVATLPAWLAAVVNIALVQAPTDVAALFVTLDADEIALLGRAGVRRPGDHAVALARAAALPTSIVGANSAVADAAAPALVAYRRASLVSAWEVALRGAASSDAGRERDAAAIELLSTLRAVLGEI